MKRIFGTIVALAAVLSFGTVSSAAILGYDLTGVSTLNTPSTLAPNPPGYFTTPFGAGSYLGINTDTNGDTVEGDVSLIGGVYYTSGVTNLGAYGTFISSTKTFINGGTGTLTGSQIVWGAGTSLYTDPSGTFGCTGPICGLLGITEGVVYPIAVYQAFVASQGVVQIPSFSLGTWNLSPGGFAGTGPVVTAIVPPSTPASFLLLGGVRVPEPSTIALLLLGLGGIAVRARKA
jgi:hypothetical protein